MPGEAAEAWGVPRYHIRVRSAYGAPRASRIESGERESCASDPLRPRSCAATEQAPKASPPLSPGACPSANPLAYGSERERIGAREGERERKAREDRKRSGAVPSELRPGLCRSRIEKAQRPDCSGAALSLRAALLGPNVLRIRHCEESKRSSIVGIAIAIAIGEVLSASLAS